MNTHFNHWLDTFIEESEIDTGAVLEAEGASGTNYIPVQCLLDVMKQAPLHEQRAIKATIVKIDFHNGDVMHFFKHLAQAIAI